MKATLSSGRGWTLSCSGGENSGSSLLISGGGPQTLNCFEGIATLTRAATITTPATHACSCSLELQPGGEGLLKDLMVQSNSRIQEIYAVGAHQRREGGGREREGEEEGVYVATCRGTKLNPSDSFFTSRLPASSALLSFSRITVKFLSIKEPPSLKEPGDSLQLQQLSLVLSDLTMKKQLPPRSAPPPAITKQQQVQQQTLPTPSQMDPAALLASALRGPSSSSSSSQPFSSEYDTFTMFAMYKSMLLTDVGQLLDAKLAPLSLQLQRLERRVDVMQQQFMCQQQQREQQHGEMMQLLATLLPSALPANKACDPKGQQHQLSHKMKGENELSAAIPVEESPIPTATQTMLQTCGESQEDEKLGVDDKEVLKSDMRQLLNLLKRGAGGAKDGVGRGQDDEDEEEESELSSYSLEIIRDQPSHAIDSKSDTGRDTASLREQGGQVSQEQVEGGAERTLRGQGGEDEALKCDMRLLLGFLKQARVEEETAAALSTGADSVSCLENSKDPDSQVRAGNS